MNTHTPNSADLIWIRENISYFQFPELSQNQNLKHGVFTRHGGVSPPPFDSLNLSFEVADQTQNVTENINKIKEVLGAEDVIYLNQRHGKNICIIDKQEVVPKSKGVPADAMITNISGIALLVKQADCQGVIIYDPEKKVVANVHCGWMGNVHNILGVVIVQMQKIFACKTSALQAAIGPSLGTCCAEFNTYKDIFPKSFERFMIKKNYFDLWAISCWQLEEAGLPAKNIEVAGICTRCGTDQFFSYRGEGNTGRFGTVVMLQ